MKKEIAASVDFECEDLEITTGKIANILVFLQGNEGSLGL